MVRDDHNHLLYYKILHWDGISRISDSVNCMVAPPIFHQMVDWSVNLNPPTLRNESHRVYCFDVL